MKHLQAKITIFVLLLTISFAQYTPTLVLEISRYGARSPRSLSYTDDWEFANELTPVGMRQQFILGAAIAANYNTSVTYNPATIYVQSEDTNLTLMSTYSQVYGTYNGTGYNLTNIEPQFTYPPYNHTLVEQLANNINWTSALPNYFMPIPIHAVEHSSDYILEAYDNCPNYDQIIQQNMNNSQVNKIYSQMSSTISYINQNLSTTSFGTINSPQNLSDFGDLSISNLYAGLDSPANIGYNSVYFTDVSFFSQWYSVYPYLATQSQIQLLSAPLIWQVNDFINGVYNGTSSLEYILLSTDEITMMSFLAAFGIVTPSCLQANWQAARSNQTLPNPNCIFPAFSSNLIIEFYNPSQFVNPYIIFRYNDNEYDICQVGSYTCGLSQFVNASSVATGGQGIYEYMQSCGLVQTFVAYSFFSDSIVLPIVLSITAVSLFVTLIVLIRKKNEKVRLLQDDDFSEQTVS